MGQTSRPHHGIDTVNNCKCFPCWGTVIRMASSASKCGIHLSPGVFNTCILAAKQCLPHLLFFVSEVIKNMDRKMLRKNICPTVFNLSARIEKTIIIRLMSSTRWLLQMCALQNCCDTGCIRNCVGLLHTYHVYGFLE